MDTHSKNTYEESLPPRRGQIKHGIFRGLALTIGYLFLLTISLCFSNPLSLSLFSFKIMDSHSKNTYEEILPPRRGQIKRGIFRGLAVTIGYLMGGFGRKHSGTGGFPNSNSTTQAATPSGYTSDAPSDP